MSQMALSERNLDGTPALALAGELNVNSAPDLRRLLMKYVNRSKPKLLLDLTGLSFMDTSGLATLIEAHLKAEKNGGMLAVFGLAARITEVFAVACDEALPYLQERRGGAGSGPRDVRVGEAAVFAPLRRAGFAACGTGHLRDRPVPGINGIGARNRLQVRATRCGLALPAQARTWDEGERDEHGRALLPERAG